MIILRNHAPRSYMTWLPVSLTWSLYNLQLGAVTGADFDAFGQSEIASSMYNYYCTLELLVTFQNHKSNLVNWTDIKIIIYVSIFPGKSDNKVKCPYKTIFIFLYQLLKLCPSCFTTLLLSFIQLPSPGIAWIISSATNIFTKPWKPSLAHLSYIISIRVSLLISFTSAFVESAMDINSSSSSKGGVLGGVTKESSVKTDKNKKLDRFHQHKSASYYQCPCTSRWGCNTGMAGKHWNATQMNTNNLRNKIKNQDTVVRNRLT